MKPMDNDDTLNNQNSWLVFSLKPQMNMHLPSSDTHRQHHHETQPSSVAAESIPATSYHPTNLPFYGNCHGLEGQNAGFYVPSAMPVMPLKSDGSLYAMEGLSRSQPQGGAMPLSLDNMVYNQFSYYSAIRSREVMLERSRQNQISGFNFQVPNMAEDGTQKNWVLPQEPSMVAAVDDNGGESGAVGLVAYGDLQPLSLSMSPTSQSSCVTSSQRTSPSLTDSVAMETKKRGPERLDQKHIVHRKSIDTFGQRTSQYRGVTRHRWTGRYEAHLWDNSCKKEGQSRKGRQVYLGGYDMEEKAARAYDLAALKYWGPSTHINFPLENYQHELEEMKNMTRQEYVAHLRRKSSGFSRGASMYRGVTRHHQHGRWQARIGRVAGNKDLYLGTYSTQEEAAEAYDIAAIKFRGVNAVTNFDISRYDVEKIMSSSDLLSGEQARRKNREELDQNPPRTETYRTESFSMTSDNDDQELDQSACLNSSREGGSHKTSFPIFSATSNLSSWGLSLPHMPVFAAWRDS